MPPELPEDWSLARVQSCTLSDVVAMADEAGATAVEESLEEAVTVVISFLSVHGKDVGNPPSVSFNEYESGVTYDPRHPDGEILVCGGPRGLRRGGEEVLAMRTDFTQPSLLTILCRGLLLSYDVALAEENAGPAGTARTSRSSAGVEIYDRYGLPAPEIDYAFSTLFDVYLEGDITDRSLREEVIDAWAAWYEAHTQMDVSLYERAAHTVSDRIAEADGTPRERICHGLDVQERLLGEGEVGVLRRRRR